MQVITDFFESKINYLSTIGIADILDILIVAYLIYMTIDLIRKTSSFALARGLFIVLLSLLLSGLLHLQMINFLLRKAVEIGLVALVILFQPELRKLLSKMGSREFYGIFSQKAQNTSQIENAIMQTVVACENMSATRTGALIIFERALKLNDVMSTGTVIDADITAELLKNIFYPKAPLHDGALIIRNSRIASAGCVLPLTTSTNLSKDLGMRHRAGIGVSEQSDALVIIVSEETGAISIASNGMLKRNLNRETFERILRNELVHEEEKQKPAAELIEKLRNMIRVKKDEGKKEE